MSSIPKIVLDLPDAQPILPAPTSDRTTVDLAPRRFPENEAETRKVSMDTLLVQYQDVDSDEEGIDPSWLDRAPWNGPMKEIDDIPPLPEPPPRPVAKDPRRRATLSRRPADQAARKPAHQAARKPADLARTHLGGWTAPGNTRTQPRVAPKPDELPLLLTNPKPRARKGPAELAEAELGEIDSAIDAAFAESMMGPMTEPFVPVDQAELLDVATTQPAPLPPAPTLLAVATPPSFPALGAEYAPPPSPRDTALDMTMPPSVDRAELAPPPQADLQMTTPPSYIPSPFDPVNFPPPPFDTSSAAFASPSQLSPASLAPLQFEPASVPPPAYESAPPAYDPAPPAYDPANLAPPPYEYDPANLSPAAFGGHNYPPPPAVNFDVAPLPSPGAGPSHSPELAPAAAPARRGRVIVVFGCRGGAGATTLATNLAGELARRGDETLLIDLDLQLGDTLVALDIDGQDVASFANLAREYAVVEDQVLKRRMARHRCGMYVLAQNNKLEELDSQLPAMIPAFFEHLRGRFDSIVIDGIRDFDELSLAALDSADTIALIATQDVAAIRRAKRVIEVLDKLEVPASKRQLVVNRYQMFSRVSPKEIERALAMPVGLRVKNDYDTALRAQNRGALVREVSKFKRIVRDLHKLTALSPGASR